MAGSFLRVQRSMFLKRPRLIAAVLGAAAVFQCLSYWPGIMTWDAITQYDQASQGYIEDWHPPLMAWLWRRLIAIKAGPAPMFLLQLGLYWAGYGLIIANAWKRRQPVAVAGVALCALMPFPLALMGSVLKDCLMEGFLLMGVGLLVWIRPERDWPMRIAAILFLLLGSLLRFNAFLAVLPLLVALMPLRWRRTAPRLVAILAGWLVVVLALSPIANRLIGAEKSHVELSLVIFDLAGITEHSGTEMFPPLGLSDPVGTNRRCYNPQMWDSYAAWASRPCPITFDRVKAAVERDHASPYSLLLSAILAHPLAYAEHRLAHFNINTRFLVLNEVQGPVPDRATENIWGFTVARGPGLKLINTLTGVSIHTPLGWPIFWIALAGGLLAICPCLSSRALVGPIAASAFLYGAGYLVFSVSSELRYHLWTITGTAIATAFVAADLASGSLVPRSRLLIAATPAILVFGLCSASRLAGIL